MLYTDMKFLMTLKNVQLLVCISNLVLSLFPSSHHPMIAGLACMGMRLRDEAWYCMFWAMDACVTVLHVY